MVEEVYDVIFAVGLLGCVGHMWTGLKKRIRPKGRSLEEGKKLFLCEIPDFWRPKYNNFDSERNQQDLLVLSNTEKF